MINVLPTYQFNTQLTAKVGDLQNVPAGFQYTLICSGQVQSVWAVLQVPQLKFNQRVTDDA